MMFLKYLVLLTTSLCVSGVFAEELPGKAPLPTLERKVLKVAENYSRQLTISIPKTALTSRNAVPGVFVLEDNRARFRMVRPGKSGARRVDILSGLFGGELLIANDTAAVHDGSPVIITNKNGVR